MATKKFLDQNGLLYLWQQLKAKLAGKVDVEEGKSLIADELITKLEGIESGAKVNVLEGIQVNGVDQTITDKKVNVVVPTKHSDLGAVAESDLDAELAEKVNAASEGNHAHLNKDLLDTYTQTEADLADAVAKKHEHANKAELDLIESGDKAKWDKAVSDLAAVVADYLKTSDKEALEALVEALDGRVTINENGIATLNGNSSVEGSVDKKIADAINAFATQMTDDGTVNTYKEALEYIASHGAEYTALLGEVTNNKNAIATLNGDASTAGSVAKAVADEVARAQAAEQANAEAAAAAAEAAATAQSGVDAIAADYVKASELIALENADIDAILAQ